MGDTGQQELPAPDPERIRQAIEQDEPIGSTELKRWLAWQQEEIAKLREQRNRTLADWGQTLDDGETIMQALERAEARAIQAEQRADNLAAELKGIKQHRDELVASNTSLRGQVLQAEQELRDYIIGDTDPDVHVRRALDENVRLTQERNALLEGMKKIAERERIGKSFTTETGEIAESIIAKIEGREPDA